MRKRVWWLLSAFLVVPSQWSWFWTNQWNSAINHYGVIPFQCTMERQLHAGLTWWSLHVFYQCQHCAHRWSRHIETFQIYPRLFYQVFTIHVFKHGQQFPLIYFFSQGRPTKPKILASFCSRRLCKNIGLEVDPQRVLTDFELALEQSIAISFPQAKKKGCPTDICESDLEGVEGWSSSTW